MDTQRTFDEWKPPAYTVNNKPAQGTVFNCYHRAIGLNYNLVTCWWIMKPTETIEQVEVLLCNLLVLRDTQTDDFKIGHDDVVDYTANGCKSSQNGAGCVI